MPILILTRQLDVIILQLIETRYYQSIEACLIHTTTFSWAIFLPKNISQLVDLLSIACINPFHLHFVIYPPKNICWFATFAAIDTPYTKIPSFTASPSRVFFLLKANIILSCPQFVALVRLVQLIPKASSPFPLSWLLLLARVVCNFSTYTTIISACN